jgi:TonB-linked SusC/RagA family outer membrane protein
VLKDAASASIYGSRAANGVILVTTKRADKGKFAITYRGYMGWQAPVVYPSVVNAEEYMTLSRRSSENDGSVSLYTDEYIANYRKNNYLDPDAFPIINWQERLMTGNGFTHNHTLNLSAGSDRIRVMTSLGFLDQNGIIKNANFKRFNLRNNMDIKMNEQLNFSLDLSGTYSRRVVNPYQSNVFAFMNSKDPLMLAQWSDSSYALFTGGTINVLPMIEQGLGGNNISQSGNLRASAVLDYKPLNWLTLEVKAAPRFGASKTHRFVDLVEYHSDAYGTVSITSNAEYNSLNESVSTSWNGYYHATASASKKFGNHNFKVLLGASYEDYDAWSLSAYRQEFAYSDYEVISAGGDNEFKNNSGSRTQMSLASFFGRINYNFKERYLFEANLRHDGSSRFINKNRWSTFPSFSAAWRVTEEPFIASVRDILSEFKLRASYGPLGNQNINSYYPTSQLLTISSISANDIIYPIVAQNSLANEDITWETTYMRDLGFDATILNKIRLTADYYHKKTDGILMQLDIPATIGLEAPYQNAGVVTNKGWEVAIGYDENWDDFSFGVQANLSDVINKIVDMKGTYGTSGVIRNQEGSSINSLYLLKCLGIAKTQEEADWINENCPQYNQITHPGDLVYEDFNEDGKIDDNDKQIIGSLIPRYTYGLTLDFGWKGFNISAQFQGVGKANAYISGAYTQPCVSGGTFQKAHLDNWTPNNPGAKYPRLSYTSDLNKKSSTFWMADASYCRLKNLQVSYRLSSITKALKLQDFMVYANATNLFTLSRYYDGYDPETAYQGGAQGATTGSIGGIYPLVSTYTFGVEIKF